MRIPREERPIPRWGWMLAAALAGLLLGTMLRPWFAPPEPDASRAHWPEPQK